MKTELYILVVVYNKLIQHIRSLESFLQMSMNYNIKILIIDNSDSGFKNLNRDYAKNHEVLIYLENMINVGLSKSYNRGISFIPSDDAWIMLSDDDTYFSIDYLVSVYKAISDNQYELLTGIISANSKPFSPVSRYSIFSSRINFITRPGEYRDIYAINSGLVFNKKLFKDVGGFDESLFLDMIDYDFMNTLRKNGRNKFIVLDGVIEQSFSGEERNLSKALVRYNSFVKDYIYYCKKNDVNSAVMIIYIVKRFLMIILKIIKK